MVARAAAGTAAGPLLPRRLHCAPRVGALIRRHQQDLYDILRRAAAQLLMKLAAAQSLMKLAADPHYVGGLMGVLCVLHT